MKAYAKTSTARTAALEFAVSAAGGVAGILGIENCWAMMEEVF
jgi:hypothetical protein